MSYLAQIHVVGGNGGSAFEMNGLNSGATLEKIRVWVGRWQVKAMKFWFTDGRKQLFGNPAGYCSQSHFEAGEHFTKLSLWVNIAGTHLVAIKFTTNQSREFYAHITTKPQNTEYPIDVGSGICVGVTGRAGHDIDSLGFMFINTIKSTVMNDVCYPTLHDATPEVDVMEIKSMTYSNNSPKPHQEIIKVWKEIPKKSLWSVPNKLEANFNFEVSAGVPEVVEVSTGYGFAVGPESKHTLEEEKSDTLKIVVPVIVPPGKTKKTDITLGKDEVDVPYTAKVEITCENDSVWRFNTSGIYKGLAYTEVKIVSEEIVLPVQNKNKVK